MLARSTSDHESNGTGDLGPRSYLFIYARFYLESARKPISARLSWSKRARAALHVIGIYYIRSRSERSSGRKCRYSPLLSHTPCKPIPIRPTVDRRILADFPRERERVLSREESACEGESSRESRSRNYKDRWTAPRVRLSSHFSPSSAVNPPCLGARDSFRVRLESP